MHLLLAQEAGAANNAEVILFWVFAVIAVGTGIAVITLRNIVHAALMLVVNLLSIAGLYLALQSTFLGIIQVIVYAGAIMVLFLFVIMLLGVDHDDLLYGTNRWQFAAASLTALALVAFVLFSFVGTYTSAASRCGPQAGAPPDGRQAAACQGFDDALAQEESGSAGLLAQRLFSRYTFPFEASALLLVVATIGAIVLGRRSDPDPDDDEAYASDLVPPEDLEPIVVTPDGEPAMSLDEDVPPATGGLDGEEP